MSKPDDIPQDVMDAAQAVVRGLWDRDRDSGENAEAIARAIMADRGTFKGPVHRVLVILPFGEFEVSSIAQPSGMTRKEFFNRITYLARSGQITRLGYGRYRRDA